MHVLNIRKKNVDSIGHAHSDFHSDNMAWFEVGHIMRGISERDSERMSYSHQVLPEMDEWEGEDDGCQSKTYELVVQYNPAGIIQLWFFLCAFLWKVYRVTSKIIISVS